MYSCCLTVDEMGQGVVFRTIHMIHKPSKNLALQLNHRELQRPPCSLEGPQVCTFPIRDVLVHCSVEHQKPLVKKYVRGNAQRWVNPVAHPEVFANNWGFLVLALHWCHMVSPDFQVTFPRSCSPRIGWMEEKWRVVTLWAGKSYGICGDGNLLWSQFENLRLWKADMKGWS